MYPALEAFGPAHPGGWNRAYVVSFRDGSTVLLDAQSLRVLSVRPGREPVDGEYLGDLAGKVAEMARAARVLSLGYHLDSTGQPVMDVEAPAGGLGTFLLATGEYLAGIKLKAPQRKKFSQLVQEIMVVQDQFMEAYGGKLPQFSDAETAEAASNINTIDIRSDHEQGTTVVTIWPSEANTRFADFRVEFRDGAAVWLSAFMPQRVLPEGDESGFINVKYPVDSTVPPHLFSYWKFSERIMRFVLDSAPKWMAQIGVDVFGNVLVADRDPRIIGDPELAGASVKFGPEGEVLRMSRPALPPQRVKEARKFVNHLRVFLDAAKDSQAHWDGHGGGFEDYDPIEEQLSFGAPREVVQACSSGDPKLKWLRLNACIEKVVPGKPARPIRGPHDVSWYAHHVFAQELQAQIERMFLLVVDTRLQPLALSVVSVGTRAATMVDLAEVMRPVMLVPGAGGFFLLHNHPSEIPEPSFSDRQLTKAVQEAAKTLNLTFFDHVIVTREEDNWYSFVNSGEMSSPRASP